jgi:hypothetical protein
METEQSHQPLPRDARPRADDAMKNESPGDGIMEDDLTEERYPTPADRDDAAQDQPQDP